MEVSQVDELIKLLNPFSIKNVKLFSDGGGDPGQDPDPDPEPNTDPTPDPKSEPEPKTGDDPKPDPEPKTFDEKYVKELRAENAKHRNEKKQYAEDKQKLENQIKSIQKALGLEDDEPDADKLQSELKAKETELRGLKIENAFSKVARKVGADEELTYAVLHRKGELNDLALDSELDKSLEVLVKQALEDNPKLKAESVTPSKTGDHDTDPQKGSKLSMNDMLRQAFGHKSNLDNEKIKT
jgi:hypothetical protein